MLSEITGKKVYYQYKSSVTKLNSKQTLVALKFSYRHQEVVNFAITGCVQPQQCCIICYIIFF